MKSSRMYNQIGSPSCMSPVNDQIKIGGKFERAAQFGLNYENEESFECNQSFPRALQMPSKLKQNDFTPDLSRIKGIGLNSITFLKQNFIKNQNLDGNSILIKNTSNVNNTHRDNSCYYFNQENTNDTNHHLQQHHLSNTFDKSWAFYNQFANANAMIVPASYDFNADDEYLSSSSPIIATTNPNKSLVVINGRTTEILTANNLSCELFSLSEEKLIGMKLKDLLDLSETTSKRGDEKPDLLIENDRLDENGRIVLCSGKIYDAFITNNETECRATMPISIYMLKLTDEQEPKCLCVMEPVQRLSASFAINVKGRIRYFNQNFSSIFGYVKSNHNQNGCNGGLAPSTPSSLSKLSASSILIGKDICELIPFIKIPMGAILPEIKKQTLTGRSLNGENIPLKVTFLNKQLYNNEEIVYNCTISVYTNISGLVTVNPSTYKINSYNSTFTRFIFGYDDKELLDKPITFLIPNFFEPDTTTTMTSGKLNATNNKMTPLCVNNSYLNANEHLSSYNRHFSSQKLSNTNKSIYNGYQKTNINNNGSFLDVKYANNSHVSVSIQAKEIQEEDEYKKKCSCCGVYLQTNEKKNVLTEFNLKSTDYSPNQKCANYIETNSFSPVTSLNLANMSIEQQSSTQASSARKSLLAKAISNNALANERSMEDLSIVSSSSSLSSTCSSSLVSLSSSPSNNKKKGDQKKHFSKTKSFSNVNVSEFENSSCFIENTNTTTQFETNMCKSCLASKEEANADADTSEVSLIAVDINDDETSEKKQTIKPTVTKITIEGVNSNKRKVSLNESLNVDVPSESMADKEHLRSSNLLYTDNCVSDSKSSEKIKKFKNQITSTPAAQAPVSYANTLVSNRKSGNELACMDQKLNTNNGLFFGCGRHIDSSLIRIFYQRKLIKLSTNESNKSTLDEAESGQEKEKMKSLIFVWISRDPYADKSLLDYSLDQSQIFKSKKLNQTLNESNAYLNEYEDIITLGHGASGFVQLARRKLDKFEVVTKYIIKSKIYKENWIEDNRYAYGKIPLECSILCKIDHPNIIKVLEIFQDEEHVQMVMEKHGCGMDLFEFIDRQRKYIDESLVSYIFRQIVSAVAYLHSNNLVHRDIKDENIVINQQFQIKLIDFGSAAYMVKGKKFATFCGTLDYCSPDVLLGNKYYGPELDVWTCGIALYTLIFSENPFLDAEETIECILKPPFKVSKELMKLLFSILCPKPELRASIEEIQANDWVNQKCDINSFKWEEVIRDTEFHANNAGDFNRDCDMQHTKPIVNELKKNEKENFFIESDNPTAVASNECEEKVINCFSKLNHSQAQAFFSKSF